MSNPPDIVFEILGQSSVYVVYASNRLVLSKEFNVQSEG